MAFSLPKTVDRRPPALWCGNDGKIFSQTANGRCEYTGIPAAENFAAGKISRSVAFLPGARKLKHFVFSVFCLAKGVQPVGTVGGKTRRGSL
jgi:hypothetical protein